MKQGDAESLRARTAENLVWPEWADQVLIEGLLEGETAYERAVEQMRNLHPKLKTDAIRKRLRAKPLEDSTVWMTVDFWRQELDFALIGGILGGVHGKSAVIDRIQKLWPRLDSKMLHERLEGLADHGTPPWAKPEFWTGALKELLLEGARGGLTAERKAIGKILHLHPELRPRVVAAQLRRVRDELRRSEGRLHQKRGARVAGQTGKELGFGLRTDRHWKDSVSAEVGRNYSGAFKPDQKRGPKSRAQNTGYGPGALSRTDSD